MRWPNRIRSRESSDPEVSAVVRVDRRTKNLTKRLRPGEIAVIDHEDLDRVSAEALVACRAGAVVNAAVSISGRYPNLGPQILLNAGIPLIDDAGADLLEFVEEGEILRLEAQLELLARQRARGQRGLDAVHRVLEHHTLDRALVHGASVRPETDRPRPGGP